MSFNIFNLPKASLLSAVAELLKQSRCAYIKLYKTRFIWKNSYLSSLNHVCAAHQPKLFLWLKSKLYVTITVWYIKSPKSKQRCTNNANGRIIY